MPSRYEAQRTAPLKEDEHKNRLSALTRSLPQAFIRIVEKADRQALETFRELRAEMKRYREDPTSGFEEAHNEFGDHFRDGVAAMTRRLFDAIAEAFWEHEPDRQAFLLRLKAIRTIIEAHPEYGGFAKGGVIASNTPTELAQGYWKRLAVREWKPKGQRQPGRAARLRDFVRRYEVRAKYVAVAANVDEGDLSRWSSVRPGEARYVNDDSVVAERIERVLDGTTPLP